MTFREMALFVSSVIMGLALMLGMFGGWLWLRQEHLAQTQNIDRTQMIQELNALNTRLKKLERPE